MKCPFDMPLFIPLCAAWWSIKTLVLQGNLTLSRLAPPIPLLHESQCCCIPLRSVVEYETLVQQPGRLGKSLHAHFLKS